MVNDNKILGMSEIAAILTFASRLMNGKSGVFLPFNGKFLSDLLE